MNADEIVRTLKWLAKDTDFVFAGEALDAAADLIESLQAQLAAKDAEITRLKVERDRAVCDLDAFGKGNKTRCGVCKYGSSPCDWCYYDSDGTLNFEWRGAVED